MEADGSIAIFGGSGNKKGIVTFRKSDDVLIKDEKEMRDEKGKII